MNFIKLVGEYSESNTYILTKENSQDAFLVDAGASVEKIKNALVGKNLKGIFLTHGHFDHINNLDKILKLFGYEIPIYLHALCKDKLFDSKKNLSFLYRLNFALDKEEVYNFVILKDGDKLELFDEIFEVYNFKGHSSCSLGFKNQQFFIVGDVVFESGVGRYDFEENGLKDTIVSLERFLKIEDYKLVLSGHGQESTVERQQRNVNSFLRFLKRS